MKALSRNTFLIPACVIALAVISGCATLLGSSWQTNAGKFLTTTALTVDAAMQGWATATVAGLTSADDQAQVKTLYVSYQGAMQIATNTYTLAVKVGDPTLWAGPSNNLWSAKTSLVIKTSARKPTP